MNRIWKYIYNLRTHKIHCSFFGCIISTSLNKCHFHLSIFYCYCSIWYCFCVCCLDIFVKKSNYSCEMRGPKNEKQKNSNIYQKRRRTEYGNIWDIYLWQSPSVVFTTHCFDRIYALRKRWHVSANLRTLIIIISNVLLRQTTNVYWKNE